MEPTQLSDDLLRAEGLLVNGQPEQARDLLARQAEDAEEYISQHYQTTDETQYFSFPELYYLLAYKKVENDPREINVVNEPFDRLYNDLAIANVMVGDYQLAQESLKQAVRWNPMDCEYRLRLADLLMTNGDVNEYLALTYSVFERASEAEHIIRAYVNFAGYYEQSGREMLCAAALKCAAQFNVEEPHLNEALDAAQNTSHDPNLIELAEAQEILAAEGIPEGANAEVAICMLMCAVDAAEVNDKTQATTLMLKARNLIGAPACQALLELIKDADEQIKNQ